MGGRRTAALMDTGCTSTLVHASLCRTWTPKRSVLVTMEEGRLECAGEAKVEVECQGRRATLDALVVTAQPLGMVDVLIGMDGIEALGGGLPAIMFSIHQISTKRCQ